MEGLNSEGQPESYDFSDKELEGGRHSEVNDLIRVWGSDILDSWIDRYGEEARSGMFRTALIAICHVRQANEKAAQAQQLNATRSQHKEIA